MSRQKIMNPVLPGGLLSPLTGADELSAGEEALIDNLGAGSFQNITPTGTINGTNDTFTLPGNPIANTLILTLNGQIQYSDTDYALSGANSTGIDFVSAPPSGTVMRAWFMSTST